MTCLYSKRLAYEVNKMVGISVIHAGIGTIMTAGKPVVGMGMQPEQDANVACLVRKGFATRVPKSKDPSKKVHEVIQLLLHDEEAKKNCEEFSKVMEKWDGPKMAVELLFEKFGS
jgi:UDP:flavonoid glycosyltransferase YjiC (YdhE family)